VADLEDFGFEFEDDGALRGVQVGRAFGLMEWAFRREQDETAALFTKLLRRLRDSLCPECGAPRPRNKITDRLEAAYCSDACRAAYRVPRLPRAKRLTPAGYKRHRLYKNEFETMRAIASGEYRSRYAVAAAVTGTRGRLAAKGGRFRGTYRSIRTLLRLGACTIVNGVFTPTEAGLIMLQASGGYV
jgi:hypothetical protein